jgi:hypothetical protein
MLHATIFYGDFTRLQAEKLVVNLSCCSMVFNSVNDRIGIFQAHLKSILVWLRKVNIKVLSVKL